MTNGGDTSHWDVPQDWARVGQAADFWFHKATQGAGGIDPSFATARAQMIARVKVPGAYHFATPGDPIAQARHFVSVAGKLPLMALDLEEQPKGSPTWRQAGVDPQRFAGAFLAELHRLAGVAIIYTGPGFINEYGVNQTAYPLWLAEYADAPKPHPWPKATIWQYSDHGIVPGVGKPCDVNRSDLTVPQLLALSGSPAPTPEVEVLDPNDPIVKKILDDENQTTVRVVDLEAKMDRVLASLTRIEHDLAKPAG